MELRFSDGSAIRVLADKVVLEAKGTSVRSTAFRFARDYARLQEGWRSLGDPGWPMLPPAPGTILAAFRDALNSLLRDRLRRARLLTLLTEAASRHRIIAELRQVFGGSAPSTPVPKAPGTRETILLLTPGCYRDLAAGRNDVLHRARARLRDHPGALVLVVTMPDPMASLQPLAELLREVEAALDRETENPPSRTSLPGEAPDDAGSGGMADDPGRDDTAPKPF